jgi:hypothetical protein
MEFVPSGYSIRDSSRRFAVPYSTLYGHANGEVTHDLVGRPPKFTDEEELCLKETAISLQVKKSNLDHASPVGISLFRAWV